MVRVYYDGMIRIFLLFCVCGLSACGFTPVYGDLSGIGYGNEDLMAYVQVANIPEREGQMLRNVLLDRINRKGYALDPHYRIEMSSLEESKTDLDITKDSDSTRGQLRLESMMTLRDVVSKEVLMRRGLYAITSYNILASEFSTRVTEQNARENAIIDLANQVEMQLNLYFNRM